MVREGKSKGFFYLDHRTVDGKCGIITDGFTTPATIHNSVPCLSRLDRQRERFGFKVRAVGLDAGYFTPHVCRGLLGERKIYGVIGYSRPTHRAGYLRKREFVYDEHYDCYICPQKEIFAYRTTTREGYREYASKPAACRTCPLLKQYTSSRNQTRIVSRHVWEEYKEEINSHRYEEQGKAIYKRRKEAPVLLREKSFTGRVTPVSGAETKQQCLLSAACQNMEKIMFPVWKSSATRS